MSRSYACPLLEGKAKPVIKVKASRFSGTP
jgi:hypothetical protein